MASDTANRSLTVQDYELVPVAMLKPHPKNPRKGDVSQIVESIKVNGFYGAVIAQKSTGHVLAGNHRIQAAKQLGIADVPVIWVDCSDQEAEKILLVDNRTNDLAEYNNTALAEILAGLSNKGELKGTGYDESDLEALLAEMAGDAPNNFEDVPEPEIDKAEELREKWGVEYGQLWEVGRHRILCGDSTSAEDVSRLMDGKKADCLWTDPPYGVSYVGKTKDALTIENDDMSPGELLPFLRTALTCAFTETNPGGAWYVAAPPGPLFLVFAIVLDELKVWRQTLNWVKSSMVLGRSDFHYKHEAIFYGWREGAAHSWYSDRTQTTCLEFNKPSRSEFHPTMKPVELIQYCLTCSTKSGDVVLDSFNGSGSTLCACESHGRSGRGMEIDPKYVAVTLERLSQMGLEPRLVS